MNKEQAFIALQTCIRVLEASYPYDSDYSYEVNRANEALKYLRTLLDDANEKARRLEDAMRR